MQRVPPDDRISNDRNIDRADQRKNGGGAGGAGGFLDGCPQRDIAEIEKEQDQNGGHPRIPLPPRAPHRLAPERAGDEREKGERSAYGRRRLGAEIGKRMTEDQRDGGGNRHDRITEHGKPGGRDMHIHDPHRIALLIVGWRGHEREPEPHPDQQHSNGPERRKQHSRQRHEARWVGIGVEPLCGRQAGHARHLACCSRGGQATRPGILPRFRNSSWLMRIT